MTHEPCRGAHGVYGPDHAQLHWRKDMASAFKDNLTDCVFAEYVALLALLYVRY